MWVGDVASVPRRCRPAGGGADHALRRVRPDGMRRTTVCGRSIPTGWSWTACARGLDGLGGSDDGEVVGTGGAWSVVGAGRHEGGHDAGGVRPAGARASRPLPLAGPAGSTRERRDRAGVGRWEMLGVGAAPTGRTTATQVRPDGGLVDGGLGRVRPDGSGAAHRRRGRPAAGAVSSARWSWLGRCTSSAMARGGPGRHGGSGPPCPRAAPRSAPTG